MDGSDGENMTDENGLRIESNQDRHAEVLEGMDIPYSKNNCQ